MTSKRLKYVEQTVFELITSKDQKSVLISFFGKMMFPNPIPAIIKGRALVLKRDEGLPVALTHILPEDCALLNNAETIIINRTNGDTHTQYNVKLYKSQPSQ